MKRCLKTFLFMMVLALLILPVTAFAAHTSGEFTVTDGDISYTCTAYATGTVDLTNYSIADTVTDPLDVVIPETVTIDGEIYSVTSMNPVPEDLYDKINSVSFAGKVPVIQGNLYTYRNTAEAGSIFEDLPIQLRSMTASAKEYPAIPAFISNNYNQDSNGDGTNDTYYAGTNLVRVDPAYKGDLNVKDGTVSILAGAFWGCRGLGAVTLPDSVEWIGTSAFTNSSVTTVNIPLGMMTKGNAIQIWTFQNCDKLTQVTFPETAAKIDLNMLSFAGCESLTGFDFSNIRYIYACAFAYAFDESAEIDLEGAAPGASFPPAIFYFSGLKKVTLGANYTSIGPWSFANSSGLTEVVFHEDTERVGTWAFENCTSLTGDLLKDTKVKMVEYRAFANTNITEITLPASLTTVNGGAFAGNEQLETLNWYAEDPTGFLFSVLNDCSIQGANYYYPKPYEPARAANTWTEVTQLKTLNIYALPTDSSFFSGMEYLQTVNYFCEVTALSGDNFQFCPSLKTVTFSAPEKLTVIGSNVFNGCLSLENFPLAELTNLEQIGSYAFFLTQYISGTTTGLFSATTYAALSEEQKGWGLKGELDLSGLTKLTTVGVYAFHNQFNVTKVHLPANLVFDNTPKFQGMANLEELILEGNAPEALISSNFYAGEYTQAGTNFHTGLKSITVKGQVPARNEFFGMSQLETVDLPQATEIYVGAFMNCTSLTNVNIPNVTTIGYTAFMNTGLTSVTVKKDVKYNNHVFINCAKLTSVTAEEGVTEIPFGMFMNCAKLTEVNAPDVETFGYFAFMNCSALDSVSAPNVKRFGVGSFMNTGLTSVTLKEGVDYETYVFAKCAKLTSVTAEAGVTQISKGMFMDCTELTEVNAPDVISVSDYAFMNTGLKEVVIQKDVSYGTGAFGFCKDLTTVVVEDGVEILSNFLLEGTESLKDLSLPETLTEIGWAALKNSGLEQVVIPAAVEIIHDDAFRGCAKAFVLEGAPYILLEESSEYEDAMLESQNEHCPIEIDATVYYANEEAKAAAEVYSESLGGLEQFGFSIEPCGQLTLTAALEQDKILAGEELTGLTVALNGEALEAAQYSVDYDAENKTLGNRTVTVTLTDETLKCTSVIPRSASATGFNGKEAIGRVADIYDADSIQAAVTVNVVDHLKHIYTKPSSNEVQAPTCSTPGKYYAQCAVENCPEINMDIIVDGTALDPGLHEGELKWFTTENTHKKAYSCCGYPVIAEESHEDENPRDHKCDVCGKDLPKPEDPKPELPKVEGVTRLAGKDRLVTAQLIADQLKVQMGVEKFDNIIIASGATFADALPGSYLAAEKNAPILLTLAKQKYVDQTAAYVKANLKEGGTVYILGGESAVPTLMEKALEGMNVKRVAGADRFGTNLAILKEAGVKAGDEILVCTGKEFADSLSAAATGKPILLVYKKLTDAQKEYLATLSGNTFCVVGGTTAVPASFEAALSGYGAVTRLAGKDRLETSILVAKKYFPEATSSVVAYGWDFPDGLCGGSLAYATKSPLILAHSKEKLHKFTAEYTVAAGLKAGYVLGGEKLVDDTATRAIFGLASGNINVLS